MRRARPPALVAAVAAVAVAVLATPAAADDPEDRTGYTPPAPQMSVMALAATPSAEEMAAAMDIPAGSLISASILGSDPRAFAISDGLPIEEPEPDPEEPGDPEDPGDPGGPVPQSLPGVSATATGDGTQLFPSRGDSFLVMSSGDASHAMTANTSSGLTTVLDGTDNAQGNDLAQLELVLAPPLGTACVAFDVAFLSDEYPEYVGSSFNDAFTAQLGTSEQSIVDGAVDAPFNFAHDADGNALTVNTAFGMTAGTGSTYDGGTSRLRAAAPIDSFGPVTLYLTIQDLGDSALDSAAFLDNFYFSTDPLCRFGSLEDSDGDGLLDEWETNGLSIMDGMETHFIDLPAIGTDPHVPDVLVEIDHMVADDHDHAPRPEAIADVVDSFAGSGVHLHVDYGPDAPLTYGDAATWGDLSRADALDHQEYLGDNGLFGLFSYQWGDFDDIKDDNFDWARAAVFHYNVWAHHMEDDPDSPTDKTSGRSRGVYEGGSDFIVSLGDWSNTRAEHAGTFMHELGHNLGLGHGGHEDTNHKPNYLSVMSYSHQFGLPLGYPGPKFDFSFAELRSVDEDALVESEGIHLSEDLGMWTVYYCGDDQERTRTHEIDWNCDGDTDDTVSASVNKDSDREVLEGHRDWGNLVFTGGAIGMPGAIVELPAETVDAEPEIDYETYLEVVGGAPVVEGAPVVPAEPVQVGAPAEVSLPFTVTAGDGGNVTAEWSWGDGTVSAGSVTAGVTPVALGSHVYAAPGTYPVTVTLTGPDGAAVSEAAPVVVVAAPSASGSATAAGWLTPAPGARPGHPTTGGQAYFAADARYVGSRPAPVGATLFSWPQARLTVVGAGYDSLAVSGATAVVEGPVAVNGRAGYQQRLTVVQGRPSAIRVQVWDPRVGGPETRAAVVVDTTAGGAPAPVHTALVLVRQ